MLYNAIGTCVVYLDDVFKHTILSNGGIYSNLKPIEEEIDDNDIMNRED